MPRKTRKRLTSKKAKTKAKTTAKIYKNKYASPKIFKQLHKNWLALSEALDNCKTKHCKNIVSKSITNKKNLYLAWGWDMYQTKKISKPDQKKINKYERLQKLYAKDLEECVKQFCNAEDKALKQIYNNSVANLK